MNFVLDIIIVCVVILFAILGAKKGFARTFVEIIGFVLAFMIAFSVANYTADYVYEKKIRPSVVKSVSDIAKQDVNETGENVNDSVDVIWDSMPKYVSAISGLAGLDKEKIRDYIDERKQTTNEKIEDLALSVCENVVKPIAVSAVKFVVTAILIIVLLLLVKLLAKVIGGLFNKSVFKGTNKFLGGLAGVVKGALISFALVGLIFIVLPLFDNELFNITPQIIERTYIFKYLYALFLKF